MSTPTVTPQDRPRAAVEHDTFADDLEPAPRRSFPSDSARGFKPIGMDGRKRSIAGAS